VQRLMDERRLRKGRVIPPYSNESRDAHKNDATAGSSRGVLFSLAIPSVREVDEPKVLGRGQLESDEFLGKAVAIPIRIHREQALAMRRCTRHCGRPFRKA
jgi:hypothetical protein